MPIIEYILWSNVIFAVFFVAYWSVLRKETFFIANRVWLLGAAVVAFIIPIMPLPGAGQVLVRSWLEPVSSVPVQSSEGPFVTGSSILLAIYLVGLAFQLVRLARDVHVAWVATGEQQGEEARSFFGRVVVPEHVDQASRAAMIAHERVHVRHGHTWDILLYRALGALSWFIPIWPYALKELKLVHEHTADAEAFRDHADYEQVLLAQAFGVPQFELTNSFRSSHLKTRMMMMLKRPSSNAALAKYLLAVPLLLLSIAIASPISSAVPFYPPQDQVVKKAEKMPEFPGGMDGMVAWMGKEMNYPKKAGGALSGTVPVQFIIAVDGSVQKAKVLNSVHPDLDAEALRLVNAMPKWTAGMDAGKKVAVQLVLPISFQQK